MKIMKDEWANFIIVFFVIYNSFKYMKRYQVRKDLEGIQSIGKADKGYRKGNEQGKWLNLVGFRYRQDKRLDTWQINIHTYTQLGRVV